jgi:DNA topoisomerase-1
MEKVLKSGVYLVCPNRKAGAEEDAPKRRGKKAAAETDSVVCHYQVRIGDAPVVEDKAEEVEAVV